MEKEFAPYEEALALRELGFNEVCLTKYGMTSKRLYDNYKPFKNSDDLYSEGNYCNDLMSAPLYQQAFRWFREKHRVVPSIIYLPDHNGYRFNITTHKDDYYDEYWGENYNIYEEAELACLRKLIEIVKEQ